MNAPHTASSTRVQSFAIPAEIAEMTRQLFPGPFEVWQESDPEAPTTPFVLLMVHAKGDPKELVERRLDWHRRVADIMPDADFRLSITSV